MPEVDLGAGYWQLTHISYFDVTYLKLTAILCAFCVYMSWFCQNPLLLLFDNFG